MKLLHDGNGLFTIVQRVFLFFCLTAWSSADSAKPAPVPKSVCPPFYLRAENGEIINPVSGENATLPYSPRQTCGKCHDYDLITQGYHFTQGAGEKPTEDQATRYQWALSPGNYGGSWCSPAPLYRYLSPKHNESAAMMDMTSFNFLTAACGGCHPGGGSAEYDRDGKRYDHWMADPASGFKPGGDNDFDGDYYKARWSESGALEADCLLCHLPDYDFEARNKQTATMNFRWAPSVGAGLAAVAGSVANGDIVELTYDVSKFGKDGKILPPMVVSPRNETCLACHAQPGWKKRGADFRARTDVHLRAGLRCVDCHPAGSRATDDRIRGKEIHQIGKGDDPGGRVRDDLDNTMRDCADCHSGGAYGAPIARHAGLPPIHLRRIACQTCHTPEKLVMPAQMQASDVFNTDSLIPQDGKQLWTFYGVDGAYRNHYGILNMMGYDNKPTEKFRPVLARYKDKIYPVNRVHSAWPAIETPGLPGLMQPRMSDIRKMWIDHREDPKNYRELSFITDDNGDGVVEVNRPEEIEALITAVTNRLHAVGYPLEGKRVVWVANNRVYSDGRNYREIPMHEWEASPFANTHKYNHDIQPARAALGANGCGDCHGFQTPFFHASSLIRPFHDDAGNSLWMPNHAVLGISSFSVKLGAIRERLLKPLFFWILGAATAFLLLHLVIFRNRVRGHVAVRDESIEVVRFSLAERLWHFAVLLGFLILLFTGTLFFMNHRFLSAELRLFHAWTGLVFGIICIGMLCVFFRQMLFVKGDFLWLKRFWVYFVGKEKLPAGKFNAGQKVFFWLLALCVTILLGTGAAMMFLQDHPRVSLAALYLLHDLAALFTMLMLMAHVYLGVVLNPHALRSIFGGVVSAAWLSEHHPDAVHASHSPAPTQKN